MLQTIDRQHPFYSVTDYLKHTSQDLTLEFSKYMQREKGRTERRIFLRQAFKNVTHEWLGTVLATLERDEELAFHSRIYRHGKQFHLPLVDFRVRMSPKDARELVCANCNLEQSRMHVYDSGRSLHAYYFKLMRRDEWLKYLGDLLLLNYQVECVDSRWVGHSLRNGFSALRWSCNTPRYESMPALALPEAENNNLSPGAVSSRKA
jgi:hypothetical protein